MNSSEFNRAWARIHAIWNIEPLDTAQYDAVKEEYRREFAYLEFAVFDAVLDRMRGADVKAYNNKIPAMSTFQPFVRGVVHGINEQRRLSALPDIEGSGAYSAEGVFYTKATMVTIRVVAHKKKLGALGDNDEATADFAQQYMTAAEQAGWQPDDDEFVSMVEEVDTLIATKLNELLTAVAA